MFRDTRDTRHCRDPVEYEKRGLYARIFGDKDILAQYVVFFRFYTFNLHTFYII